MLSIVQWDTFGVFFTAVGSDGAFWAEAGRVGIRRSRHGDGCG